MSDYFEEKAREWALRLICPLGREPETPYEIGSVLRLTKAFTSFGRLCAVEGAKAMRLAVLDRRAFNVPYIVNLDPSAVVEELEKEGGR